LLNRGFSLVEVIIVCAIIATFSVALILNFRAFPKNRIGRSQVASVVESDVRRMQAMAFAGSRFQGASVCGYGIHYNTITSYILYAGVLGGGITQCQNSNHNYQAGVDLIVETKNLPNSNMQIRSAFSDVFFESPDPKTYINNNPLLTGNPITITIELRGQVNCNQQSCTDVVVYPTGRINLINN